MSSKLREIASSCLGPIGIIGAAEIQVVANTSSPEQYWTTYAGTDLYPTISGAHQACTSGRNDVVLLAPTIQTRATTLYWTKNMTHLVGMYGPAMMNHRSRISHGVTLDPLIDITGFGCTFANIYTMYAETDAATDLTAVKVTGNRNSFVNCHIGGPMGATAADQAGFAMMRFHETDGGDGLEHYFKNCTIGIETIAWSAGVMFRTCGTPRLVFENCMFLMRSDANTVQFFDGTAGDGAGFVLFKNCTGINLGTALLLAIGSTGLASGTDYIFHNSGFTGCTDVIAAADEAKAIAIACPNDSTTGDLFAGLGIAIDHTA